jgi:hypothetical protein
MTRSVQFSIVIVITTDLEVVPIPDRIHVYFNFANISFEDSRVENSASKVFLYGTSVGKLVRKDWRRDAPCPHSWSARFQEQSQCNPAVLLPFWPCPSSVSFFSELHLAISASRSIREFTMINKMWLAQTVRWTHTHKNMLKPKWLWPDWGLNPGSLNIYPTLTELCWGARDRSWSIMTWTRSHVTPH